LLELYFEKHVYHFGFLFDRWKKLVLEIEVKNFIPFPYVFFFYVLMILDILKD